MATILVIEDSEIIRSIMRRIFEGLGHEVIEAEGPAAAIDLCVSEGPDIVFLDWDLPSLGALDFLRDMNATAPEGRPKTVLCLTENDPRQIALARAVGAPYHILKPFDPSVLHTVLLQAGVISQIDYLADDVARLAATYTP